MEESKSLLRTVVTWTVLGVLAILAFRIALRVLAAALGLAWFLLFTIGPLVLVGWLAVKIWKSLSKEQPI